MAEKFADTVVSTTELAGVLGLSARRISQLKQDDVFVGDRGKYPLGENVQRYINFAMNAKRGQKDENVEAERAMAEARLKKAKADMAELQNDELHGSMHRAEDVQAMTEDLLMVVRSLFIALPGRLAVDVSAVKTAAEAAVIIRREVHMAMRELADYQYDPAKYAERVRERMNWTPDDEEA